RGTQALHGITPGAARVAQERPELGASFLIETVGFGERGAVVHARSVAGCPITQAAQRTAARSAGGRMRKARADFVVAFGEERVAPAGDFMSHRVELAFQCDEIGFGQLDAAPAPARVAYLLC